jgi:hypothetical protein
MSLTDNQVEAYPDWVFGIVIRMSDQTVRFDLTNTVTGQEIHDVVARSPYRRTDTAKLMEGEHASGYEACARRAIEMLADA